MKVNVTISSVQLSVFFVFSLYYGVKGTPSSLSESTTTNNDQGIVCNILAHSVSIAHKAAEIIREIMNSKVLDIVSKDGKQDFQTRADTDAQRCIVASLRDLFPNVKIIGEEKNLDLRVPPEWKVKTLNPETKVMKCPAELRDVKEDQVTIWVDPLDGTREFTDGYTEHVTILIGIAVDDDVVAGVIYQPFWMENKGRAVWGVVGDRVHGLDVISRKRDPYNCSRTIFVTSKSHTSQALNEFMNLITSSGTCVVNKIGGSGYKVIRLLEGEADVYVYPSQGCKRWDTAAPEAVLRVAKGNFTDVYGNKYSYSKKYENDPMDKGGIIATAPGYEHYKLIKLIENFMPTMTNKPQLLN